jgi:hypothetical protein
MNGRSDHVATLLFTGKVLVTGGSEYVGSACCVIANSSIQLFDPATHVWSEVGPMVTGRAQHTATLLLNGSVLIAGGVSAVGPGVTYLSSAELWPQCTGPVITQLTVSPSSLWPPNHKMVPVTVAVSNTGGCGSVFSKITSITSNEEIDADGDWVITGSLTMNLRASRSGNGNGRIYTITVQSTDSSGNFTTATTTVIVAHDQGK